MGKKYDPTPEPVEIPMDESIVPEAEYLPPEPKPPEFIPPVQAKIKLKALPMMPDSIEGIINNLMVREIQQPTGEEEPMSRTVGVLRQLIDGMSNGTDLTPIKNEVIRIATHQPEKNDLYSAVINLIDQERVVDAVEIRGKMEKKLKQAVYRGDLTTQDSLAVWKVAQSIINETRAAQDKFNKSVDSMTVISKIGTNQAVVQSKIKHKWNGTTPQGRELMRKRLFELKQALSQPTSNDND